MQLEETSMKIQDLRRNYEYTHLTRDDLQSDPMAQFRTWFELLQQLELPEWFEINAMTLATADAAGHVSSRIVLLKAYDPLGFTFFTNYRSAKGRQLDVNPRAALTFYWPMLERQVRVVGTVAKTPPEISDLYFQSRPEDSRLGAIASPQSEVVDDESLLAERIARLREDYAGRQIPRPEHWGGYRLTPTDVEFWQGRPSRLHDRFRYLRNGDRWQIDRLAP
jgi:pyridoxamine 5'-phosphate oxidase